MGRSPRPYTTNVCGVKYPVLFSFAVTRQQLLESQSQLLEQKTFAEIQQAIRDFGALRFRRLGADAVRDRVFELLEATDRNGDVARPSIVQPVPVKFYPSGSRFYRVRTTDYLCGRSDCWCPPDPCMKRNRLNRTGKPILYTSPQDYCVAVEEIGVDKRAMDMFSLIVYCVRRNRQVRLTHIGGVEEGVECPPELRVYLDCIHNWFARDVGQGTEYLYNISNAIKDAYPRGDTDGWCYPSVAHRGCALNAAFVPSKAEDKLEVVAVIAAQTWRWTSEGTDRYAVRFMQVGTIQSDKTITYEVYDHDRHRDLVPGYEPPDIANLV